MTELTADEELAFLTVLSKRIKARLDELNGSARQALLEGYGTNQCDRRAVLVRGEKVGEVGISYGKAHPYIKPECAEQALRELDELGLVEVVPAKGWEDHFAEGVDHEVFCKDTGTVCDWAMWVPKQAKSASVRIKDKDTMAAFGPVLKSVDVTNLLGGGN